MHPSFYRFLISLILLFLAEDVTSSHFGMKTIVKEEPIPFFEKSIALDSFLAENSVQESFLLFEQSQGIIHCLLKNRDFSKFYEANLSVVESELSVIKQVVEKFRFRSIQENKQRYLEAAHNLYQELIDPIKPNLHESVSIIVNGSLSEIPWDGLVVNMEASHKEPEYLVLDHEIRILRELPHLNTELSRKNIDFLGFAPEFKDLMRLENKKEIDMISKGLYRQVLTRGLNGNKVANFMKAHPAKIIHFASHGIIDSCRSEKSGILLENGGERLSIEMIKNLELNADLVFANTCVSSKGHGNENMSISDAFLSAGVQSVIGTLWQIDDAAALEIARHTYVSIRKGQRTSTALRRAKLEYLHSGHSNLKKHPIYWSAYQLYGENEVIFSDSCMKYKKLISLSLSFLTTVSMGSYYFGNRIKRALEDQNWV